MCQITYFFGKRPELSQKKSRTMFFKARYHFFLEFLNFFWSSPILLAIFFDIFLFEEIYLNVHYEGNAHGEFIFFQKFQKQIILGLKKTLFQTFPDLRRDFVPSFFVLGHVLRHFYNVLHLNNWNLKQNIAEMS